MQDWWCLAASFLCGYHSLRQLPYQQKYPRVARQAQTLNQPSLDSDMGNPWCVGDLEMTLIPDGVLRFYGDKCNEKSYVPTPLACRKENTKSFVLQP